MTPSYLWPKTNYGDYLKNKYINRLILNKYTFLKLNHLVIQKMQKYLYIFTTFTKNIIISSTLIMIFLFDV